MENGGKKIRVSSKIYDLVFVKNKDGGSFDLMSKTGDGKISIGLKNSLRGKMEVLLHELVEATLTYDSKRWKEPTQESGFYNAIFVFDHDYLCDYLPQKLIESLDSIGAIDWEKAKEALNG